MRKKTIILLTLSAIAAFVIASVVIGASTVTSFSSYPPLSYEEEIQQADIIVIGKVRG